MSAIYGAIDLNRNAIDKDLPARFDAGYTKCKIDKNNSLLKDNVYMHCGVQYFYPRAKAEKLPFYDEESNIYITADCVIDNRKELLPELVLEATAPDGDIIFAAYKKWGKECCKHLQGLFSFVIYDAGKNEIFAAVDQFAQRCLFYHVRDGVFYFSTLFFPIPEATGLKFEENERWLVDTVSLRSPVIMTEPKETALKDIYKIVCGTDIIISKAKGSLNTSVKENRYYNPSGIIKTDWTMTLEQSENLIRDTMARVMETILQEQENVAAQLSSGLDSSTVACNAAVILKKRGGNVYSFTAVPLKEAGLKDTLYTIYDETEGVNIICNTYSNIVPEFVDCKDRYYLLETEEMIDTWELPCKSQQNAIWIDEIAKMASDKGLRVLLSGATGNTTFSAGDYLDAIIYYISKFRFKTAYDILNVFKVIGISRKRILKIMIDSRIDYIKWYFDPKMRDCYKNNVTDKDFGEKYDLSKRFRKTSMHYRPYTNMERMRETFYFVKAYAQIGEYDTKGSLKYGIITRDPTRTVDIVNMCYRIPLYCYANKDFDRRLIRVGMKGIVPDEILSSVMKRGRQSGDNAYRIALKWKTIREKWIEAVKSVDVLKYFDEEKLDSFYQKYDTEVENAAQIDALLISDLYSFAVFMRKLKKCNNIDRKLV